MILYDKSTGLPEDVLSVELAPPHLTDSVPPHPYADWIDGAWVANLERWKKYWLRPLRDAKLKCCDFTQLPDAPLTAEQKAAWTAYRQALRDLPNNDSLMPENLTWPEVPC